MLPASNLAHVSLDTSTGEMRAVPSQPVAQPVPQPAQIPVQTPAPEKAAAESTAATPTAASDLAPKTGSDRNPQFSKGFAAMAKKDRELRALQMQIKSQRAQLEQREAQMARFEQLKHQNPVEAVKALGLSYEDLTNFQLAGGQTPTAEMEINNIKQQMTAYVQKQEAEKQQAQARIQRAQEAQVQQTLQGFRRDVSEFVKSKPDEFELTNIEGEDAVALIADTIEQEFYRTKQIMPKEKAAALVEEYLTQDMEKKRAAKKWQAKQEAEVKQELPPGFVASAAGKAAMERAVNSLSGPRPTLNNSMTSSTSLSMTSQRIDSDRMRRAAAALDGKR
jgi:hypothetical protein